MAEPAPLPRLIQLVPGTPVATDKDCPICFRDQWSTTLFALGDDGLTQVGELLCCFACAAVDD